MLLMNFQKFDPLRLGGFVLMAYPLLLLFWAFFFSATSNAMAMSATVTNFLFHSFWICFFVYPLVFIASAILYFFVKDTSSKRLFSRIPLLFLGVQSLLFLSWACLLFLEMILRQI